MSLRFTGSPTGTRNLGQGGGANLVDANLLSPVHGAPASSRTFWRPASSFARYYGLEGVYDGFPNRLSDFGTTGNAVRAAKGYDYIWLFGNDHASSLGGNEDGFGRDSTSIYAAFSNDPLIPPDPGTMCRVINGGYDSSKGNGVTVPVDGIRYFGMVTQLLYDAGADIIRCYAEGGAQNQALETVGFTVSDFDGAFTPIRVSHACTSGTGQSAYQYVYYNGGSWYSFGEGYPAGPPITLSKWTSSDGIIFTNGANFAHTNGATDFTNLNGISPQIVISGTTYHITREDARGPGWSSGTTYALSAVVQGSNTKSYQSLANGNIGHNPTTDGGVNWQDLGYLGMYVSLVPVNPTTGAVNITGTPPIVRLSNSYQGIYPGPTYLQGSIHTYEEDGIVFIFATHGFYSDTGLVRELPENGGGLNEQYRDIYKYIKDPIAAAGAKPSGARCKCDSGTVTIEWYDVLPHQKYRVYSGTTLGSQTTLIGDVNGLSITDHPTPGSVYYYKVVTMNAGVEAGYRVVSTYVS